MTPLRIQRKRTRGWKAPGNTVDVTKRWPFGNPFLVHPNQKPGKPWGGFLWSVPTAQDAVECFRLMIEEDGPAADALRTLIPTLRGKNLMCFCKLCRAHKDGLPLGVECADCEPCHATVLLALSNKEETL